MRAASVLIIDRDSLRRTRVRELLRDAHIAGIEASTFEAAKSVAEYEKPDLILCRFDVDSDISDFEKLASAFPSAFIVPFIQPDFSEQKRSDILALNVVGFLNETLPRDEWIASIRALLRQKRLLERRSGASDQNGASAHQKAYISNGLDTPAPLRERAPELYKGVLERYEEAIKQVLQHRIYKIEDDVFEPFRLIAKELFLANATARDAVELHYHTLRKIAPSPDAPRAQGYLEVGRTTIIGLMGDLLTYYRNSRTNGISDASSEINATAESGAHSAQT
jgi:DNA-binding NarL/FixJ family response regulator